MTLIERHRTCIEQVYAYDYWVELFERAVKNVGFSKPVTEWTEECFIRELWNKFWFALPDSGSIHRPPFNEICDLCCEEEDDS